MQRSVDGERVHEKHGTDYMEKWYWDRSAILSANSRAVSRSGLLCSFISCRYIQYGAVRTFFDTLVRRLMSCDAHGLSMSICISPQLSTDRWCFFLFFVSFFVFRRHRFTTYIHKHRRIRRRYILTSLLSELFIDNWGRSRLLDRFSYVNCIFSRKINMTEAT